MLIQLRTSYVGLASTNTPNYVHEANVHPIKNGLKGLIRTNIRFCKDHRNSKEHKKWAEHNVCPLYLLEPTPGMHCLLASSLGTNIFPAFSLLAPVLAQFDFEFCNQNGGPKSYCVIL